MKINKKQIISALLLLVTAIVWGIAFVAQSDGMNYVGALTFHTVRTFIGGLVLLPIVISGRIKRKKAGIPEKDPVQLVKGGIICGAIFTAGALLQQFGIAYTTVSKAGFLCALYIIIVPIIGVIFGNKIRFNVWIGVFLSIVGVYLLCMKGSLSLSFGDSLAFISSFFWALHILAVGKFANVVEPVELSCFQFFATSFITLPFTAFFDKPTFGVIMDAWLPILYAGAISCAIGWTFQTIAQKNIHPTAASLILGLESVFSAVFGCLILHDTLSMREILGCVFMFSAMVIAQIDGFLIKDSTTPKK